MFRAARLLSPLLALALLVACGGSDAAPESTVPVDASGFPTEWPIATPPGSVDGCDNGTVLQDDSLFSVVMCLPEDPDPFTASERYLATLEADGFAERDPGAFIVNQATFLDGNGIEIFYQLIDDEATIVLIKPGS